MAVDTLTDELTSKLGELLQNVQSASPQAAAQMKERLVEGLLSEKTISPDKKKTEGEEKDGLSADIRIIHTANVMRIYKLIDEFGKSEIGMHDDVEFWNGKMAADMLPDKNEWDFKLGDRVAVDLDLTKFKLMQKQTIGWRKTLGNVVSHSGFVTGINSKYDNAIEVYFSAIYTSTRVYAGALKRFNGDGDEEVPSRWKFNDFVKTRKNKKIVKRFQARLPDIPDEDIGKKGRVIAVTDVGIFVTFDEKDSYAVNPALLLPAMNSSPIQISEPVCHPSGLSIGDNVRIISHMKKLIENQKEHGGWNWKMSSLYGKTVTISNIQQDASLNVRMKNDRSWRINYASAFPPNDLPPVIDEDDVPFLPGDKVRVKLVENANLHMMKPNTLDSTITFLEQTAVVEGVDDDLEVVIRFNMDQKIHVDASSLRKATKLEAERFERTEARRECLAAGDLVRVDAGPEAYVTDVLTKSGIKGDAVQLLTDTSTMLGLTDENHAVIRYEDGKRFNLKLKYLTPVVDFTDMEQIKKPSWEVLQELQSNIETCIKVIHIELNCESEDSNVDLFSITNGWPPVVGFKLASTRAVPEKIFKNLQTIAECRVEKLSECEATVTTSNYSQEIHVILLCGFEPTTATKFAEFGKMVDSEETGTKEEEKQSQEESAEKKTKARPFVDPPRARVQSQQRVLSANELGVRNVEDLSFLPFSTPAGTVYLACFTPNQQQANEAPPPTQGQRRHPGNVRNNFASSLGDASSVIVHQHYY